MKVSIGQLAVTADKSANLAAIAKATAEAASVGSSLIVFPEMAMWFKHGLDEAFVTNAETIPGRFSDAVDMLASKHSIAIAAGMIEAVEGETRVYNTIYVASPGKAVGTYRKMHLYDAFGLRESDVIAPSNAFDPMVFALDGIKFGLMTCYDVRFPESARLLVDAGAEVLLLPSAWTPGVRKEDHWETLVRARAIENTSYVVASNQAAPLSTGSSMIVDPMGIVVAQLMEGPETRTAEISASRVASVRTANPCIANRRFRVESSARVLA
ncbi:carbon-nitrogen hydrolase family protein [Rhizobium leguminosarum]|uniref:carbon-nitrogen hydrolase family protein n=1 Tax=Rhizobium leguminosarum TaxID=384 RepID=UPI00143F6A21|nr:carbon-nitrogen hydrolase family protein [Rhizobium leguminosarum]NKL21242.1 hydrolase [Rhizobium leguminosarum bv. viciae]NKL56749.1 hydrolase [Rhizobium leguminosarum bv. viciae]